MGEMMIIVLHVNFHFVTDLYVGGFHHVLGEVDGRTLPSGADPTAQIEWLDDALDSPLYFGARV
jgi:hypothetical protein